MKGRNGRRDGGKGRGRGREREGEGERGGKEGEGGREREEDSLEMIEDRFFSFLDMECLPGISTVTSNCSAPTCTNTNLKTCSTPH